MVLFHPIYKGPIWHELNNDRLGTPCGVLCCAWGEDPAVSFHIASMLWGSGLKRESKSRFWAHSFFWWLGHNNEGIEGCSKKWVKFWKFWKFAGSRGLLFIQVVQIFYGFQWILFPPYESFLSWKTRCFNRLTTSLTSWKITPTSSSTGGLGFCCASCFSGPLPNGKVHYIVAFAFPFWRFGSKMIESCGSWNGPCFLAHSAVCQKKLVE